MTVESVRDPGSGSGLRRLPSGRAELFSVVWFTLLFVLAIGIANGDSNQNSYLLSGMRLANPDFLPGDWYTGDVVHLHWSFTMLVAALARSGFLIPGLTVGVVIQNSLFAFALYFLLRALYDRPLAPWAASLALFASLGTLSLGYARWLMPYLEASSLSGTTMLLGIAFLARRKALAGGVALGLSGLIHEHFFVLTLPVMAAVSCAMLVRRNDAAPWKGLGLLWGAFLLLSSPTMLTIVRYSTAAGAEEIRWLTASLFPYHAQPATFPGYFYVQFVAAVLMGTGGILLRRPHRNLEVSFSLAIIFAVIVISVLLATAGMELATLLWPWRLSALVLLAGLAAGTAALATDDLVRPGRTGSGLPGFGFLLLGVAALAHMSYSPATHTLWAICTLPLASGASEFVPARLRRLRPSRELLVGLVLTIAFMPVVAKGLRNSHVDFRPASPERTALYEWVRAETAVDAVFAMPPSWEDFRLNARRPVVADWKSIPRYAPDRIEWLGRIRALTGVERPGPDPAALPASGGTHLDLAYAEMDCSRAEALHTRFGVRFVIHERSGSLDCGHLVYEDEYFRVWELGDTNESSGGRAMH